MFNKALAQINLGYVEGGMTDMQEASRQKVTDEHGVIDDAIRDYGEGYTVFSIVRDCLRSPFVWYLTWCHLAHRCAISSVGKQTQEFQEQRLSRKGREIFLLSYSLLIRLTAVTIETCRSERLQRRLH